MNKPIKDQMLYVSFNQDSSCFAIGTQRGFKIYSSYPLKNAYERILDGGIGIVEMLYKSNIIALVGGGHSPKFNKNKVIIWDDYQNKIISELKFTTSVLNVKLKRDKIFVVCSRRIFIFNLQNYHNLDIIDTLYNPKGLFGLNRNENQTIIAFPISLEKENIQGYIKIKNYNKEKELLIHAQDNIISYISINNDGTMLASSSNEGTIIRIHRISDGLFLQEFKRGIENTEINYICFDNYSNFLATTCDRGIIHIWSLENCNKKMKEVEEIQNKDNDDNNENINNDLNENKLSFFQNIFGFRGDYSFAQITLNEQKCICTFDQNNNIIVIGSDGKYYHAILDSKKGGNCVIDNSYILIEKKEEN